MKKPINLIQNYLNKILKTKQSINKHLNNIDLSLEEIKNTLDKYEYLQEQTNNYKVKLSKEKKIHIESEIKNNEKVYELNKEIKLLKKQNRKLEKQLGKEK